MAKGTNHQIQKVSRAAVLEQWKKTIWVPAPPTTQNEHMRTFRLILTIKKTLQQKLSDKKMKKWKRCKQVATIQRNSTTVEKKKEIDTGVNLRWSVGALLGLWFACVDSDFGLSIFWRQSVRDFETVSTPVVVAVRQSPLRLGSFKQCQESSSPASEGPTCACFCATNY